MHHAHADVVAERVVASALAAVSRQLASVAASCPGYIKDALAVDARANNAFASMVCMQLMSEVGRRLTLLSMASTGEGSHWGARCEAQQVLCLLGVMNSFESNACHESGGLGPWIRGLALPQLFAFLMDEGAVTTRAVRTWWEEVRQLG